MRLSPRQLHPRRLSGGPRGWAAIHFTRVGWDFAVAEEGDGLVRVTRESSVTAAADLRAQVDPRAQRVVTALACEDVLCRALRLPSSNDDELKQMLDLQIDQLIPVPLEEVVYDFEPLETRDGETLVLVAIARKSVVDERVTVLEEAGLPPERVVVDALALFRALWQRELIPGDERLNTVVLLEAEVAHVIVYTRGWPLLVRSVFSGADLAMSVATLGEELARTRLAAQAEWPDDELGGMTIVTTDPALHEAATEIANVWPTEAQFLSNGQVPSMASCLCPSHQDERRFNLLPDEWRQRRRRARYRRTALRALVAVGVVYLVVLLGLLILHQVRKMHLNSLRAETRRIEPDYLAARRLQSELVAMGKQLDTKYSALDTLREVSLLMPGNLKLTAFVFQRDDKVTLKGQSDSAQAVYDFISRLEQCPLFAGVKTVGVPTAGGLTKFELVATLKSAAGRPGGGG